MNFSLLEKVSFGGDFIRHFPAFIWRQVERNENKDSDFGGRPPPSVRCGDFLRFIDGRPILSYFPDPIKVRSGQGVFGVKKSDGACIFLFPVNPN